jgi:hypothetical protein
MPKIEPRKNFIISYTIKNKRLTAESAENATPGSTDTGTR